MVKERAERLTRWLKDKYHLGVAERIHRLPTRLNEFGVDEFGMDPEYAKAVIPIVYVMYRKYFRVEVHGIENVPKGRVLLIANHAGQLPIDGAVICAALFFDGEPPRLPRSMIERWVASLPFVSTFMRRTGQIVGTPENCRRLLQDEEAILVFPEGVGGVGKLFAQRYQLQTFGHGFMRLALESKAPIVPVAVIGSEEQAPSFYNFKPLADLLGFPYFPITPTFPWNPLGLFPYPVKYRIYFGEPLSFEGDADEEDAEIAKKVKTVKATVQRMINQGLRERNAVFW